jgi:hypothetical protein
MVGFFLSWYVDRSYDSYLNNQQADATVDQGRRKDH